MNNERMQYQTGIFAHLFRVSNNLQTFLDRELKDHGLTAKQFFLMIVIDSFGSTKPSFRQAADRSGSSYQNVKQIALKLENSGYLKIMDDEFDKRTKRLHLTQFAKDYWSKRDDKDIKSLNLLFKSFTLDDLKTFISLIHRLGDGITSLEKESTY